jgi:ribonuclease Y
MDPITILVLVIGVGAAVGAVGIQQRNSKKLQEQLQSALTKSPETSEGDANAKADKIILEAEKKAHSMILDAEKRNSDLTHKLDSKEKALDDRERKQIETSKSIADRMDEIERKENALEQAKKDVKVRAQKVSLELEKIAGLTKQEAEQKLKVEVEAELSTYMNKKIKEAEVEIKHTADEQAREILVNAMQRSATEFVAETTSTTFEIPNEEMKGKIIGKEGRNIRSFERMTGVDIIIDEAPELVTVSSFDPIRREVAALAIQKLLKDGRVHPGAIEETVHNIKNDLAKEIYKTGEKIAFDAGFPDLPEEIIKLLGRFKYRFSYGQNLVKHSLEMVNIGQQIAQEIGADVNLTKKACLLHDLGKVLTYEIEGKPHHHISGDIVRKYLKDEVLANAVESHHGDIEPKSIEAVIVQIADAISGARPGARRDTYDNYVKRVSALEDIAKQYSSVKEAYAINAGREVRVIVEPKDISDEDTALLAHRIAKEIEEKENYPGTVKVNVIREYRVEAEAK